MNISYIQIYNLWIYNMEQDKQLTNYWTKEMCSEEAMKYSSRTEFAKGSKSAYRKACREGWLDEIMPTSTRPKGYWTKERIIEISNDCKSIVDFKRNAPIAYKIACSHGWKEDVHQHIETHHQQFTKEECRLEALKYNNKDEFKCQSPLHYHWAKSHRFLTEICSHMNNRGNKRHVYVFEFEDHHAYIGLSLYPQRRGRQHLNEEGSVVYKYIKETECRFSFKVLTDTPIDNAVQEEIRWIQRYKDAGWILLNKELDEKANDGSPKYTKEYCVLTAKKFLHRRDFQNSRSLVYNYALRHGFLDEICQHMDSSVSRIHYWTKEQCQEEALKYKTRKDFQEGCRGAYAAAYRNKWLDEICSHMERPTPHNRYWTIEKCREEALKYSTRKDFQEGSGGAYNAAKRMGLLDSICAHMSKTNKPAGYWTKARCLKEAKKNKSMSEFRKNCPSAFNIAWRNGWIDDIRGFIK